MRQQPLSDDPSGFDWADLGTSAPSVNPDKEDTDSQAEVDEDAGGSELCKGRNWAFLVCLLLTFLFTAEAVWRDPFAWCLVTLLVALDVALAAGVRLSVLAGVLGVFFLAVGVRTEYKLQCYQVNEFAFDKIEVGMSEQEVERILGGPPGYYSWRSYGRSCFSGTIIWLSNYLDHSRFVRRSWHGDRLAICVWFDNHRVVDTYVGHVHSSDPITEITRFFHWLLD